MSTSSVYHAYHDFVHLMLHITSTVNYPFPAIFYRSFFTKMVSVCFEHKDKYGKRLYVSQKRWRALSETEIWTVYTGAREFPEEQHLTGAGVVYNLLAVCIS